MTRERFAEICAELSIPAAVVNRMWTSRPAALESDLSGRLDDMVYEILCMAVVADQLGILDELKRAAFALQTQIAAQNN